VSLTVNRARCLTACGGFDGAAGGLAALSTTLLVFCHSEGLGLHTTSTAPFTNSVVTTHRQPLHIITFAFAPITPGSLASLCAARKVTGSSVHLTSQIAVAST